MTVREVGALPAVAAAQKRCVALAPHCASHAGGAALRRESLAPATGFSRDAVLAGPAIRLAPVLKVRSYRFYLEALEILGPQC